MAELNVNPNLELDTRFEKHDAVIALLIWLPLIFCLARQHAWPAQVVTHYGIDGQPDGWGPAWMVPVILLIPQMVTFFLLKYAPSMAQDSGRPPVNPRVWLGMRYGVHGLVCSIGMTFLLHLDFPAIDIERVFVVLLGVFFLLLGAQLNAVQMNYFVGIRTAWTLDNEEVWRRTHKFTSRLWVYGSIVLIISALLFRLPIMAFIGYVLVMVLVPLPISFFLFRKTGDKQLNGNSTV